MNEVRGQLGEVNWEGCDTKHLGLALKEHSITSVYVCCAGKPDVVVTEDEEYKRVNFEKFRKLSAVFQVGASPLAGVVCDAVSSG